VTAQVETTCFARAASGLPSCFSDSAASITISFS
jgi:hypothetical protein